MLQRAVGLECVKREIVGGLVGWCLADSANSPSELESAAVHFGVVCVQQCRIRAIDAVSVCRDSDIVVFLLRVSASRLLDCIDEAQRCHSLFHIVHAQYGSAVLCSQHSTRHAAEQPSARRRRGRVGLSGGRQVGCEHAAYEAFP